jgi:exodeoxyribonuclease-3
MADGDVPVLTFQGLGYDVVHHGEGRWNGVAILSRVGIDDVVYGFADGIEPDTDARVLTATCGGVRVATVYVPNGRSLDDDHYQYKLSWLARLRTHLDAEADPASDVVVLGDWNIAPDDRDVYDLKAFEGATHVSDHERKALDEIKGFGLVDVFRQRYEADGLYSWWDYRGGNFHKKMGLRIDYLLASRSLAARSVSDLVDRNARKGQKPSDHAPVLGLFADR